MRKKIFTREDLKDFRASSSYSSLLSFIEKLAYAASRKPQGNSKLFSICEVLNKCRLKLIDFPPKSTKTRFGNESFRDWHKYCCDNYFEGNEYLRYSFGDPQRLDYGTGHELNFICYLYCLWHEDEFRDENEGEFSFAALVVFGEHYMSLMRSIFAAYWLEPAGSHGVWGLDDYHFLPFLFGAHQLIEHPYLKPKSVHSQDCLQEYSSQFLYLSCISEINRVKKISLRWHSPMLDDISAVKTWSKVANGLFKMYKEEVLGKLPIMQHFLFGDCIDFEPTSNHNQQESSSATIIPIHQHRGDCCGNPIPSVYAAAFEERKIKKMPFD